MYICIYVCAYIIDHIFFIHSSTDGHVGGFHVLVIVNKATVNMGAQRSLQDGGFISSRYKYVPKGVFHTGYPS